ncbi:MAG: phosphomannomutase/phosphoglucomutase [Candidatus Methylumidiphilus sp.]
MKTHFSIGLLVSVLGLLALTLVLVPHAMLYGVTRVTADEANEASARLAVDNSAHGLAQLIALLGQSVAGQAGDPKLTGLLAHGDPSLVLQEEDRMTRAVPYAWLVRLLPENADTPDEARQPRMGFADLNLAHSALAETTQPAVHLANSPDAHLAMAMRLANGGGVVLASWPLTVLAPMLTADGACAVELRQDNITLAYQGDASCKEREPSGELPVAGTPWKISYWAKPDIAANTLWFAGSFLGSALLVVGATIGLIFFLYACLRHDRKNLMGLVNDMISGGHPGDYSYRLNEFTYMGEEIIKIKRAPREVAPVILATPPPIINISDAPPDEDTGEAEPPAEAPPPMEKAGPLLPSIYHANDIRGIAGKTLTPDVVYSIGLAIGSEMDARGENYVALARDGRFSSQELGQSLAQGLVDSGRMVINLGRVPTPLLYYATHALNAQSGVMLTGGHNPGEWNGLKIVIAGETLADEGIQALRGRVEKSRFVSGAGKMSNYNLVPEYIERVVGDTQLGRNLKIVVDCGNGVAAEVAPSLLRSIGCEVIELYSEIDGHFPRHPPDPSKPENLEALIANVLQAEADLGVAFDGDGDRLGLVDSSGKIIWADRQMMLFAADVLSREPGADIIYDVKCSRHLPSHIVKNGGRPLMWKSGHAAIKAKIKESGAMLAGDMNGHIYFQERWFGFDDGIYACARMVEILSNEPESTAEVFAKLPDSINTPELHLFLRDGENLALMEKVLAIADFPDARVTTIDGLRVDFLDGWGLVRACDSMPALSFRFEADTEKALATIQQQFENLMIQVNPDIELPFAGNSGRTRLSLL